MAPKKAQAAKAKAKKDDSKSKAAEKDKKLPERTKGNDKKADDEDEQMKDADNTNGGAEAADSNVEDENQKEDSKDEEHKQEAAESDPESREQGKTQTDSQETAKKRKAPPTTSKSDSKDEPPKKAARSSTRTTGGGGGGGTKQTASSKQILNFLLSKDSIPYCFPSDELDAAKANPKHKTYSLTSPSSFTPFEQLIISHVLAKPLSHTLGMRSIRTLLNPPHSLNSAEAVVKAGEKGVWDALEAARTQHRQKTADYIHQMAQEYQDSEAMYELSVEANDDGAGGVVNHIKRTVKGMGVTGAEIFCRRIQCVDGWGDAIWPYADRKCFDSLKELGVNVKDADELQAMIEQDVDWDKVGEMGLSEMDGPGGEKMDMEMQVQVEFVVVLERAIGCVLEKKVKQLREAALK